MTLHAAIQRLLEENSRAMTTQEIADQLNSNRWYTKKDGSQITAFQVHGRTRQYNHLFVREGATVSLNSAESGASKSVVRAPINRWREHPPAKLENLGTTLISGHGFVPVDQIDSIDLGFSGIYCLRLADAESLPEPFRGELVTRNHDVMYIGIATVSLAKCLRDQELRGVGHGTFFRSIGAALGYNPPQGSLIGKRNERNYRFATPDKEKIVLWLNKNLLVNVVRLESDFETIESALIGEYRPLMNIAKNPSPSANLRRRRAECVRVANASR